MPDGELLQFNAADPGNGVDFDDKLVAVCGGSSYIGLSIELISGPQPGSHGVFVRRSADVQPLEFRHGGLQLFLDLCLCPAQHIPVDALAGLWIVSGGVSSLPAAVASLARILPSPLARFLAMCVHLFSRAAWQAVMDFTRQIPI